MHVVIAWCGFVGAWLLFAGPVFQAATELEEDGFERDELTEQFATVEPPPRVSGWWWLLPPVGYLLNRRRSREHRRRMLTVMTQVQVEQMVRFGNTATGWLFVAGGAFFIALKETWELGEIYEWPLAVFTILIVLMVAASTLNTVLQVRRSHGLLAARAAAAQDQSPRDVPITEPTAD